MSKTPKAKKKKRTAEGDAKGHRHGILGRFRAYFLAGIVITAPVGLTFYIVWLVIAFIDARVAALLPAEYNPSTYLPFPVPGLGILILAILFPVIGYLGAGLLGRWLMGRGERILQRMPVVRNIYGALKQIFETILAHQSTAFREVVLIEYPRRGIWAIGFVSGRTMGEVQNITEDETVNVFLPTTPNPTSGFLLFVPRKDLVQMHMTVEEGLKMVISGGLVTPADPRPAEQRKVAKIKSERPVDVVIQREGS